MPESITWKCWGIHVHVGCPLFQTIYRSSTLVCHFGTYSTNVCDELHVIVHVHAEAILKDWKQYDFKFSGVLWIHNINCHFYTTVHVCRNAVCMCVCVCVCVHACVCACVCVDIACCTCIGMYTFIYPAIWPYILVHYRIISLWIHCTVAVVHFVWLLVICWVF